MTQAKHTLSVTLSHNPEDLKALKQEWEALQQNSANRYLYNSWEWVNLVWQHLCQDDQLWLLTARDAHGALVGVTALLRHAFVPIRGTRWCQLSFLAAQVECDHLDFVCAHGQEAAVANAFITRLFAEQRHWDRLWLSSIPEGSPTLAALQPYLDSGQEQPQPEVCPYISLPSDWETFLSAVLGQRKRKNYRRDQRRYAEAFGADWSYARAQSAAELSTFFEDLVRLHQAKWEALGEQGAFGTPQLKAFHRAVAERFLELGWLRLYRLVIKGEVAAVDYGFAYQSRYYAFAGGWDTRFAEYSPGDMLTGITIQEAIAEGMREFDFHRGDQPYKYYWGAQNAYDHTVTCLVSRRARREQQLLAVARHAWQSVKCLLPEKMRRQIVRLVKRDLTIWLLFSLPAFNELAIMCV
ncbi:MAG: GNAT family N-acetyltransferase [Anaerolineae bacterium]|nr:GNAT family N-acetyltransferase [Anaerolineae bacterium]